MTWGTSVPSTNTCRPIDGTTWPGMSLAGSPPAPAIANSRYGPFGSTFVDFGTATVTVPDERATTGSFTVRLSPSTRWVWAVLRTSTTPVMWAASGVWITSLPAGAEDTPCTTGRAASK